MKRYLIRENGSNWFLSQMSQDNAMLDFERKVNEYSYIELIEFENKKQDCKSILEEYKESNKTLLKTYKGKYYEFVEKAIDNMYDICDGSIVVELSDLTISLYDTGDKIIHLEIFKKGYECSYDFDWNNNDNIKGLIGEMARKLKHSIENYYEIQMHKQIDKANGEIELWSKNK